MSVKEAQLKLWMVAAQTGDKGAYQELLTTLEPVFRRFAFKLKVSVDDIDDVVQNTLVAIHSSRHTYLPNYSFLAWAFSICRRKINDHFRIIYRLNQVEIIDETLLFKIFKEDTDSAEHNDQYETLLKMLDKLSVPQKTIVTAIKLENRRIKDIAESLNMSEASVKTTAHRGYKKLKEIFTKLSKKREA